MNTRQTLLSGCGSRLRTVRRRRVRPFTMAEVIVAGAVVALASLGIFGSMIMAHYLIENAREYQEAEKLAVDKLWAVFNERYDDLVQRQDNPSTEAVPQESLLYALGGTIRTAILRYSDHCRIMVRVDWNGRTITHHAQPASVTLWVDRYNTEL